MRSLIHSGHIFYYVRKDIAEIINPVDPNYKRIEDFGIVPITFIKGYYPRAHDHFFRDLNTEIINPNKIRHVAFSNGITQVSSSTGILWYLHADKICPNYYDADLLKSDTDINISKFKAAEIYYMENYANDFAEYIHNFENINLPSIDFIVTNLGKEYEFLYDVLYDALEIIFWHGSVRLLTELQFYLDKLLNEEIILRLPDIASFYWRKNAILRTSILENYINELLEKEKEQMDSEKQKEIKKMKKKIIRRGRR